MLSQSLPQGGISGKPIEKKSNDMIKFISKLTDNKFPVIGSGGIYDYDSAQRKLDAGAVLLQIYTSFIYEGPNLAISPCKANASCKRLVIKSNFKHLRLF